MSSSVFFKFKSQKEPQRVTFDGTGISVFELKRDIIDLTKLGDGTDFDLAIYSPDSNEEYDDDTTIVSRGTTVVARRLPASRPGAGRAARYVSGKMPVMAKNHHRLEAIHTPLAKSNGPSVTALADDASEEDRIAAMFDQGGEQWHQQQQMMASQKAIHRTNNSKVQAVPDKPLPDGYICHRCGDVGHWIQACPTNSDASYDNRPKFRKTTGIPRSFLKVVEKPSSIADNGPVDISQLPAGVMYTATGEWVVAEPDKASWDQFQAKAKASAEKADNMTSNQLLRDMGLECPIDKRMFVDAVKTPCCGTTYCRECIEDALLSSDFICPNCSTDGVLVDNLTEDSDAVKKIQEYQDMRKNANNIATDVLTTSEQAPATAFTSMTPTKASSSLLQPNESPTTQSLNLASSSNPAKSPVSPSSTTSNPSKKRAAEDELDNPRAITGPNTVRSTNSNVSTPHLPAVQPVHTGQTMDEFVQHMNTMAAASTSSPDGSTMNNNPFLNSGFPMGMPMMNPMMMMGGAGAGGMFPSMPMSMSMPMGGMMPMSMSMPMGMPMPMPMPFQPNIPMHQQQQQQQQQFPYQNWQNPNNNTPQFMTQQASGAVGSANFFPGQQFQNGGNQEAYMRRPVNHRGGSGGGGGGAWGRGGPGHGAGGSAQYQYQQRPADYRELG